MRSSPERWAALKMQPVDERGIALGEGVELVGQGEHDVPVADVEEVRTLAFDPSGLRKRLTLGAVAIPTRCVLNRHHPAVLTARLEPAEHGGTAVHQRVDDALLLGREPMRVPIGAGAPAQDVSDLQRRPGNRHRVVGMGHCSGPGGTWRTPAGPMEKGWQRSYPGPRAGSAWSSG